MQESRETIEYDTSCKKYPYNKYFNNKQLANLSKKVFNTRTIEVSQKMNRSKKHSTKPKKKSINSAKTMSSSRAKPSVMTSITQQNYRNFSKEDIADQLHQYKELCLRLRRQNCELKEKISQKNQKYKENIFDLQSKINKLKEKSLDLRERQLKNEHERILDEKSKQKINGRKQSKKNEGTHRPLEGEFKRFFLHFLDHVGRVDDKVQKRVIQQKNLQDKLLLGQKLLKEGCQYLRDRKYKFNSLFE